MQHLHVGKLPPSKKAVISAIISTVNYMPARCGRRRFDDGKVHVIAMLLVLFVVSCTISIGVSVWSIKNAQRKMAQEEVTVREVEAMGGAVEKRHFVSLGDLFRYQCVRVTGVTVSEKQMTPLFVSRICSFSQLERCEFKDVVIGKEQLSQILNDTPLVRFVFEFSANTKTVQDVFPLLRASDSVRLRGDWVTEELLRRTIAGSNVGFIYVDEGTLDLWACKRLEQSSPGLHVVPVSKYSQ